MLWVFKAFLVLTARPWLQWHFPSEGSFSRAITFRWNISQNFNQSLWNYIFISHEMYFFTLIIFLWKAIKWWMKGREVTKLNSKGLRNNNLNYKDQSHCKQNPADSEIPYYRFYNFLLSSCSSHRNGNTLHLKVIPIWSILEVVNFHYSLLRIQYLLKIA